MAALSVMISPPESTSVGTCRIGFTGATRSLAASSAHVAPSTSAYGIPRSVSAASTAMDPEPEAPYRIMASNSCPHVGRAHQPELQPEADHLGVPNLVREIPIVAPH